MNVELVVFDVAGTTVWDGDNAVARALCDALRAKGVPATEAEVDPVMGLSKPLAIRKLFERHGARPTDAEVRATYADFESRIVAHYRTSPDVRALPGVEDTFAWLRARGIKIGLDTGFDRVVLDAILDRLRWKSLIDVSVGSNEVEHGRPHPDMIRLMMKRLGITDSRAVAKVGDSVSDIEEGLSAGCGLVVAVLCDRTRSAIGRFPGVHGVNGVSEMIPLIERSRAPQPSTSHPVSVVVPAAEAARVGR